MASLAEAIENAYNVFSAYEFSGLNWANREDCNVAYSDLSRDNLALGHHSLRELTAGDLGAYYHQAISIIGTVDDFKHFLPRMLELLVSDPRSGFHPTVLRLNLEAADFSAWSEGERLAVLTVLTESGRRDLIKLASSLEQGAA